MAAERTDGELLHRANYGARNLFGLAILLTVGALVGIAVLVFSDSDGESFLQFVGLGIAICSIVVGAWMLSVAARQGQTLPLSVMAAWVCAHVVVSVAGIAGLYMRTHQIPMGVVVHEVVPLLLAALLLSNRTDLLELKRRGLSDKVFGPEHPTRVRSLIGGFLLFLASAAIYAMTAIIASNPSFDHSVRHDFTQLIEVDEKDFTDATGSVAKSPSPKGFEDLNAKLSAIDDKARELSKRAKGTTEFTNIETYRQAVAKSQSALLMIHDFGLSKMSQARMAEGDALRAQSLSDFDKHKERSSELH